MKHACTNDFMEIYEHGVNNKWVEQHVQSQKIENI